MLETHRSKHAEHVGSKRVQAVLLRKGLWGVTYVKCDVTLGWGVRLLVGWCARLAMSISSCAGRNAAKTREVPCSTKKLPEKQRQALNALCPEQQPHQAL